MANESVKRVYNLIILDESGSMQSIKQPIINGFNEIIQSICHEAEKDKALEQWLAFYSFSGAGIKEQLALGPVSGSFEITASSYQPNNSTPLYDAIGSACNKIREALPEGGNSKVLVTILTDGEENSSTEYGYESVTALIRELKTNGWYFTYIGANHDVEKVSVSLHISSSLSLKASYEGVSDFVAKEKKSRSRFYEKMKNGMLSNPDEPYFDERD